MRDPWRAGLPLGGFVSLLDAESGKIARVFIGRRERERFSAAVSHRETQVISKLEHCGARSGFVEEKNVERDLLRAFGIA